MAMRAACGLAMGVMCAAAGAQVYTTTPQWQSADLQVSTGAALVDINRDGWLDLVISNGNDISLQRVVVYYNNGSGTLQASPGWQSANTAYHGHLDVADVNGDGWPDVAVGILLAQGGPSARLYLNNNGTLGVNPVWSASISADSFGVAFGDMNGDGRPDLAVASGKAYDNVPQVNAVYANVGGMLATTPTWQTPTPRNFGNCLWIDADRDGKLDLAYAGSRTDSFVFRNIGTTLESSPTWRTNDSRTQFGLMFAYGDVNGDGFAELMLADNNQIGPGSGRFRQYAGLSMGFFNASAVWTYLDGYTSAVTLGDIDRDGRLDLVTGEWFGRARYFRNLGTGTGFGTAPTWTSAGNTTTVEKLVLGDVNNTARKVYVQRFSANTRRLLQLPRQPIETVVAVKADGVDLTAAQYTWNPEVGWVSIGVDAATVDVAYVYSRSLDLAVSNWDDNLPNQVYLNQLPPPCGADFNEDGATDFFDYLDLVAAFSEGSLAADFNLDGVVDFFDYLDFVGAFSSGC
jgi:hypothetical protein